MNRKTILTLGVSGAMLLSVGAAAATMFNTNLAKMFSSLGDDEYSLVFSNTSNKLDSTRSESLVKLGQGNNRTIAYSGYNLVNDKWGSLADGGYFTNDGEVTNRIGGLYSVSYHIDGELKLYYGYLEHGKPTYYNLTLDPNEDLVTFDSNLGYPDVFKVANEGESSVEILDMQFSYSCSQQDLHHHTGAGTIVCHEVNNQLVYEHHCDICDLYYDPVDVSMYKIRLGSGTSSTGEVEYNPYTVRDYNTLGSLSFNANTTEFTLALSGDHSSQDLWINANTEGASTYYPRLVVSTSNSASIQNVTQRGGYGILIFDGDALTFNNGSLSTEAVYTTVRSNLTFAGNNNSNNAIDIENGQLVLERSTNVNISGYSNGIVLKKVYTNAGINQTSGSLTISNCTKGIVSNINEGSYESRSIVLKGSADIRTSDNAIRMTDGSIKATQLLLDSNNTYYFESTDSNKTTLSVTDIKFGSSQSNPTVTVKTHGGTAISDSALQDNITLDFAGGTTTLVDENNSGSGASSTGIKNVNSSNEIKVRNNATLNINNFTYGVTCTSAVSTITITSHLNINGCYGGIKETTINVGTNEEVEGYLLIDVPADKGSSDKRSYGIQNNSWQSINCVNGTAAIYSSSKDTNTSGIVLVDGFASGRITVNDNCKLGFKNIGWALENKNGDAVYATFDIEINILGSNDNNRTVGDSAWWCGNKPTINYIWTEQEFNNTFHIQ